MWLGVVGKVLFGVSPSSIIFFLNMKIDYSSLTLGGGWAGTGYFIDPTTGIAMVFGTQVLASTLDIKALEVGAELEHILYKGLVIGSEV